jgi:hypothetical protein
MFKVKKISSRKINRYLVVGLLFLMLLLGAGQEYVHDHEPDLEHHHDCPAYQLYLLFSLIFICFCVFWFLFLLLVVFQVLSSHLNYSAFYRHYFSRAPPFRIVKNFD